MLSNADRQKLGVAGLGLAAILFLAVNIFSNSALRAVQWDLTDGRLFTLSEGTHDVLSKIDEPITVRLFFSRILGEESPQHATYYERVRELLERYVDLAGGMLRLEIYDPAPFSDDEDKAVAFGLSGVPINNAGDLGYFGLAATNSTDDKALIAFFTPDRESFLEYDLTKLIHGLAVTEKNVVGLLSSIPINGGMVDGRTPREPWAVMKQISEFFEVEPVPVDVPKISDNIGTLMIVHPKGLKDKTLYAIDQFVLGGGRTLVFVDPNAEVDAAGSQGMASTGKSEFNKILTSWGVELRKNRIVGDLDTARRVNVRDGGKLAVSDYVAWLALRADSFDRGDAMLGDLGVINVASAGILDPIAGAGTQLSPLITVGPRSMEIDAEKVSRRPDVLGLFRDFKSGGKKMTLATRITGHAKSAFPDGPPALAKDGKISDDAKAKHLAEAKNGIHAIVIADVDLLHESLWADVKDLFGNRVMVPFANNGDFVVNALESLSGSRALTGLRGRATANRPFHLVREIRQAAELRYRAKEKQLKSNLDDVRAKLNKLIGGERAEGEAVLKPEERQAIEKFRNEMLTVRRELRGVQHALRQDIDNLHGLLKFLNIAAIPLLLGIGTVIFTIVGRTRRRRHMVAD